VSGLEGTARRTGLAVLDATVGQLGVRLRRSRSAVVALFHRVGGGSDGVQRMAVDELAATLRLLQDTFTVVTLEDLVARRRDDRDVRGLCAITFDDGYRDFLTEALPVLRQLEVPATHFVVTESVRTGKPPWNHRLNHLARLAALPPGRDWKAALGGLPAADRDAWLDDEEGRVGRAPQAGMLTEDDLLALAGDRLVTWGSHTATHSSLGLCRADVVASELTRSRDYLRELDVDVLPFLAYPNGSTGAEAGRQLLEAGYQAGFGTGQRPVHADSPLAELPRFDVGGGSCTRARLELGGVLPALRRVRGPRGRRP
jgi:peptidoglycan/xylan/chitin deacetylase (PgdA/CDA1 family)